MNDGLNYKDICCTKSVYFMMFRLKDVPGGIEKITASAGRLKFLPGGPTRRSYIPGLVMGMP